MYRFAAQDALIEGMYQFTMLLLDHRITPIFVFDGAPPPEKSDLIKHRRRERRRAELKLIEMEKTNDTKNLNLYKRRITRLRRSQVYTVKSMLTACGVTWYQASGEADQLCAKLVRGNHAWACMSEDMDMLVYGCSKVLRYVSILQKTVVLYSLDDILSKLNIPFSDFQKICILSGTDYQKGRSNLYSILTKYDNGEREMLNDADTSMFQLPNNLEYEVSGALKIDRDKLRTILKEHGFVFVNEA